MLGNPHSENPASAEATRIVEETRADVLDFFGADPEEYTVVFTANASAALKLVGESYPFRPGSRFTLLQDAHNSVNGIRMYAEQRDADVAYLPIDDELRMDRTSPIPSAGAGRGLFSFPAQSNFSGVQHPLALVEEARSLGYDVLLDAAAFVPTNGLDLGTVEADFACVSFYKMFGFPTGLGALIARREALERLERPWFAGGTVEYVSVQNRIHQLLVGAGGFEDGTLNFLGIAAVQGGLAFLREVGMDRVHRRVAELTGRLLEILLGARHASGEPSVRVYGPHTVEDRGGTVSFNLLDPSGGIVPYGDVERAASEQGIALRGGCFCNPGAAERALELPAGAMLECLEVDSPRRVQPEAAGRVPWRRRRRRSPPRVGEHPDDRRGPGPARGVPDRLLESVTSTGPRRGRAYAGTGAVVVLAAALLIPVPQPHVDPPAQATPFRWDADDLLSALEAEYERVGEADSASATAAVEALEEEGRALLGGLAEASSTPLDALDRLTRLQFELAVLGAARPDLLPRVEGFVVQARVTLMRAAAGWPLDRDAHEALYRVIYGGRVALDESLVQAGPDALPPLTRIEDVPSETPSMEVEGVRIHSGDILLSRGGAPTSALIARGSDFPSSFSHAALAYVDAETGEGTVIESLIEEGSVLHTVPEYLDSKKHRILVLRLRPDHPALRADPLLPHHAAEAMLRRVQHAHIPYDFAMEWADGSRAFCSEIVYDAYRDQGVELWAIRSAMSAPGLVRWLSGMGVRELTSLVPSDLEYDPQVRAVVEWRNAPELEEYRLDNAVTDALLEEADRGADLGFPWYALPLGRLLKAYSVGEEALGARPRIPEGMSAATALRVQALVTRVNPTVKASLRRKAGSFRSERGFQAPYWTLVSLAREALAEERPSLAPALRGE